MLNYQRVYMILYVYIYIIYIYMYPPSSDKPQSADFDINGKTALVF